MFLFRPIRSSETHSVDIYLNYIFLLQASRSSRQIFRRNRNNQKISKQKNLILYRSHYRPSMTKSCEKLVGSLLTSSYGASTALNSRFRREDPEVLLTAVKRDDDALQWASTDLQGDRRVVSAAVQRRWRHVETSSVGFFSFLFFLDFHENMPFHGFEKLAEG